MCKHFMPVISGGEPYVGISLVVLSRLAAVVEAAQAYVAVQAGRLCEHEYDQLVEAVKNYEPMEEYEDKEDEK